MSDDGVRASGLTPAEEEAHVAAAEAVEHMVEPDEQPTERVSPRFTRLRFDWRDPRDRQAVHAAHQVIDQRMVQEFPDAFLILAEIQEIVRLPVNGPNGEPLRDAMGLPVWQHTPGGRIIEDYSRLTRRQMESFLGQITTRMFAWEQTAERLWMDAMMARAQYEGQYAVSYDDLRGTASRTTVDDRNQYAAINSFEERAFAVIMTSASRRAAAIVKDMGLLGQRLKDIITST